MFTPWAAFLLGAFALFIPLSITHFASFFVLGRVLGTRQDLTALAATGIAFAIGTALIIVFTALIAVRVSLFDIIGVLIIPFYILVLFVPIRILYGLSTVRAIGASFVIGVASIVALGFVPILAWFIRLFV